MFVFPRANVLLLALGLTVATVSGCAQNDDRSDGNGNNAQSQRHQNQYGADDRYRGENRAWNNANGQGDPYMGNQPSARYSDNAKCPVMGGDVSASASTAQWRGRKVGFCCNDCVQKWNRMSDAEKDAAWSRVQTN